MASATGFSTPSSETVGAAFPCACFLLVQGAAFAPAQHQVVAGGAAGELLAPAVGPADPDGIHPPGPAQPEVGADVAVRQVTAARVDGAGETAAARQNGHLGPVGVAPQGRVQGPDRQPLPALGGDVAVQP